VASTGERWYAASDPGRIRRDNTDDRRAWSRQLGAGSARQEDGCGHERMGRCR
jgi:hypothetical protein